MIEAKENGPNLPDLQPMTYDEMCDVIQRGMEEINRLRTVNEQMLKALCRIVRNPDAQIGGDIRAEAIIAIRSAKGSL